VNDHDNLVRVGDIQILAQKFARKVWIGMLRVQQRNAIAQIVPLRFQRADLIFPLRQQAVMFTPCQKPAWPRHSDSQQKQQQAQSQPLGQIFAQNAWSMEIASHISQESQMAADFKPKR
jgi:hypothetical protein